MHVYSPIDDLRPSEFKILLQLVEAQLEALSAGDFVQQILLLNFCCRGNNRAGGRLYSEKIPGIDLAVAEMRGKRYLQKSIVI